MNRITSDRLKNNIKPTDSEKSMKESDRPTGNKSTEESLSLPSVSVCTVQCVIKWCIGNIQLPLKFTSCEQWGGGGGGGGGAMHHLCS